MRKQMKGQRQERPTVPARPADACAEPYHHVPWHCWRTLSCSFGGGHAGHPRLFPTGVVATMASFGTPRGTGARLAEGATKGHSAAYTRTTVFLIRVTLQKYVSLLAKSACSKGPFSTVFEGCISLVASHAKGLRQQHVWCLARVPVLALHALRVCACFVPKRRARYSRVPCPPSRVCQPVCIGSHGYNIHAGTCLVLVRAMHARMFCTCLRSPCLHQRVCCVLS